MLRPFASSVLVSLKMTTLCAPKRVVLPIATVCRLWFACWPVAQFSNCRYQHHSAEHSGTGRLPESTVSERGARPLWQREDLHTSTFWLRKNDKFCANRKSMSRTTCREEVWRQNLSWSSSPFRYHCQSVVPRHWVSNWRARCCVLLFAPSRIAGHFRSPPGAKMRQMKWDFYEWQLKRPPEPNEQRHDASLSSRTTGTSPLLAAWTAVWKFSTASVCLGRQFSRLSVPTELERRDCVGDFLEI